MTAEDLVQTLSIMVSNSLLHEVLTLYSLLWSVIFVNQKFSFRYRMTYSCILGPLAFLPILTHLVTFQPTMFKPMMCKPSLVN